jgi:hypothetical protein
MKRFVRSRLIFTCAVTALSSSAFAQINTSTIATRLNAPMYRLQLTATPANQVAFGNPVTLSAKVMEIPPNTAVSGAVAVPTSRLRFTFKAQMTSPCAGMNPVTIATTSGPVATWNAAKGGNYTVTVHVTSFNTPFPVGPNLPDVIGDATLSYVVTGGPATPPNLPYVTIISTPVVPASGTATAPANVTMTANWNTPSYPAIYKLSVGCQTAGGTAPSCPTMTTGYISPTLPITLPTLHLATSGQYLLELSGVMIRQSDCQMTGVVYTHVTYVLH